MEAVLLPHILDEFVYVLILKKIWYCKNTSVSHKNVENHFVSVQSTSGLNEILISSWM